MNNRKNNKKLLIGNVSSTKMDKTITVVVETKSKHKLYDKLVITHKKYFAHDEDGTANNGDRVEIIETRPLSKKKCWRLKKIIERAA